MLVVLLPGALTASAGAAPVRDAALDVNSCGIDEFEGTALDTARWTTVLRPNPAGLSVTGGQLRLQVLAGDLFGSTDTAQNVVLQDTPNGAWTATAQFTTSTLTAEGQQSGIVVRKNGTTFSKFVFINKGSGNRRFEHIFTRNQQARLADADFTPNLPADFPAVVKVRVISDGATIRGEYASGSTWLPIGRPAAIGSGVQAGVYAADDADGPIVPYDSFSLNAQSDEFTGDALEKCRWSSIVRESTAGYRVANGALEIDTGSGEINDTAPNLIGQPVPGGQFEAETKVDLATTTAGQQAGLVLYKEPANWLKIVLVRTGATTAQVEFVRVLNGQYQLDAPFQVGVATSLTSVWLRMRGNGANATAQYSTNGTMWTEVGKARPIGDLNTASLGPVALRGGAAAAVTARFDYVRVRPASLFTTVGITRTNTRQFSQINGNPPYSLPAEEMPPSGAVDTTPDDPNHDLPLRMPDTSGTVSNLADFRGQTLTLDPSDQKPFTKLHFFGTTADGSGGGNITLTYDDDSTRTVAVNFEDWCGTPSANAHVAIGRMTQRYRTTGGDGAQCQIYHVEVANPVTDRRLVSVTLPAATAGSGGATRAYLMALSLEEASGEFEMPDFSGVNRFPNDSTPPESTVDVGGQPSPSGWHTVAPRITITGTDAGGSGVEQVQYRINGGTPQFYTAPFNLTTEGELTFEYRSVDRAGNAERFKEIELKVDATAPATTASTFPEDVEAGAWHDTEVTVGLRAGDGPGSGTAKIEYRVNPAAPDSPWLTYDEAFDVGGSGTQTVEYRSTDTAGNVEATKSLNVRVDVTAPTTTARFNGAAPVADYTSPVRVAFTRADGEDSSGAVKTEYRVNDGEWTEYVNTVDLTARQGYQIDFRSTDLVGNVENFQRVRFTIRAPAVVPALVPQAPPAPAPKPYAALEEVSSKLRTLSALRGGRFKFNVSCQGVSRGTVTLTVERSVVRKLKLKTGTLARAVLRCGEEGRATVSLRPSAAVRKALARSRTAVRAKLTLRMTGAAADTQTVTFKGKS